MYRIYILGSGYYDARIHILGSGYYDARKRILFRIRISIMIVGC